MSCVGPFPASANDLKDKAYALSYKYMKPGLTGLWQIDDDLSLERRALLDKQYVKEWSLWLDMKILLKTIPAVLKIRDK